MGQHGTRPLSREAELREARGGAQGRGRGGRSFSHRLHRRGVLGGTDRGNQQGCEVRFSSGALERDTLSGISTEPSPTNWPTCEQQGRGEGRGSWKPEGEKMKTPPPSFPIELLLRALGTEIREYKGMLLEQRKALCSDLKRLQLLCT